MVWPTDANVTPSSIPTVLGYTDKDNKYLPPYNWWADSAAKHLIDVVNKYYSGTGMSFYLQQASTGSHSPAGSYLSCRRITVRPASFTCSLSILLQRPIQYFQ